MMIIVKLLWIFPPIPPQVSAPLHHWLSERKKISIFDDAPHPFGIETNIAGCFDLTAQIDYQTCIMGHSMYSPMT